jgi:hypothetical protein
MRNVFAFLMVVILSGVWVSTPAADRATPPNVGRSHLIVSETDAAVAQRFGPRLAEQGRALLPQGAMDAAWREGLLYVVSKGRLSVFRTEAGRPLAPVGELQGLGTTRQIALAGRLAAVTARDDGLWLIDVSSPDKPELLSHYDTIELATGIALAENVALVACRQYGVEQIDISDPRRPRHLSTFRTGEAQSVFLHNGLAYLGDWAPREVVVYDLHNPWLPAPVAHLKLDGFGDGLFVRGNVCFAATGHHRRGLRKTDPDDPAYGAGHGLEIFDVSDPRQPKLLSRTKLPRFYNLSYDMWDVQVSGNHAVVGDTHNGIYVFDIRDLAHPVPVGFHRLPLAGRDRQLPDAVGGFAIGHDVVYVAGIYTGLHTIRVPGIRPIPAQPDQRLTIPSQRPPAAIAAPAKVVYRPEGQVHEVAVDPSAGDVWVAAGTAGLHRLTRGAEPIGHQVAKTESVAFSVDVRKDLVLTGEGLAGLGIWRKHTGGVELLGRYRSPAGGIGQVRLSPDNRYAIVHAGGNLLEILDLGSPGQPRRVLEDRHIGLFYRTPFSHGFLNDGRFGCVWHVTGMFVFDLAGPQGPQLSGWTVPGNIDCGAGMAVWRDRFLATYKNGYVVLADGQSEVNARDIVRIPERPLRGKPTVFGDTLYTSQRWEGVINAVDIQDSRHPRLRWSLTVEGNPGPVMEMAGQAIIPAGYDGVVVRPK